MENIIENVKGIMESIHLSQERIENGTLSQKDQKNLIEMLGEMIEDIDKRTDLQQNDKMNRLKEHLGTIQDAFVSQNPVEILSEQKELLQIADQINQDVVRANLIKGIFQKDIQIMEMENEKADLVQQLIDLDMQIHGEISNITRQALEASHVSLPDQETQKETEGRQHAEDNARADQEETKDNKDNIIQRQDKDTNTNVPAGSGFIGTIYLSGTQTNKENFYGKDLASVLNKIRMQQEDPDSPIAKVKTVYIREQGSNGTSLKYDIASGKDVTPIYLKLPFVGKEEFKKMTAYLKENGAVFNPHKKEWYVTREQDLSKFEAYLPTENLSTERMQTEKKYDKSLKENNSLSVPGIKENSHNVNRPSITSSAPSNSLMKKLNDNKIKAEELNKQSQPHEPHREAEVMK